MKRWHRSLNITVIVLAAAAFVFAASGMQPAIAADELGKTASSAETKMMNKTDKAPKSKTMGNGADKVKAKGGKTGLKTQGDDVSLKKGGKTTDTAK